MEHQPRLSAATFHSDTGADVLMSTALTLLKSPLFSVATSHNDIGADLLKGSL
jgi:hypothetical protein